ncbi:translation initiation factor eIF-2B subunit delta [Blumeria hordei DH14]|uniref:Translation initiation factor eIF2B subunit delta n=1 Tax=Blumeria graminis f. sp. hordei (strain DH14) TaxID=546991 RepID=N1J5Q6_BLUG1|nr:translation initiation factor eIF-2B subunit delta [Blumeria hordei DH14]
MDPESNAVVPSQSCAQTNLDEGKSGKSQNSVTFEEKAPPSTAELKKKAKEEKAARRARTVLQKQGSAVPAQALSAQQAQRSKAEVQKGVKAQHKRVTSVEGKGISIRCPQRAISPIPEAPKEDKTVEFFRHLYKQRTSTIAGVSKEVHPAVLALGLQMNNYTICGSCARLVATLLAFQKVIQSYTTPPMNSLTRHLTSHVLSPQIEYLSSCRPLSISMGNAIRWLKLLISKVDPNTPDAEAKKYLCDSINVFIRERVTLADEVISKNAVEKIRDGDVIMTYAKSSLVQRVFLHAFKQGKQFQVIVVDSRPLHEGKHLAAALAKLGIDVKYCLLNGLSHNIQDVTKVFLGAHAMMSNGRLFSRIGTALVAMEANEADKPVIVLCETIKFTERVALDSIVHNEIAPADELVISGGVLEGWRNVEKLQLCNPMYDVTPAEFIQMIVTELGNVPPTSVPVLHRLENEA